MISLFFVSSLGPLEPELAPFKDLQEIGDPWKNLPEGGADFPFISDFRLIFTRVANFL